MKRYLFPLGFGLLLACPTYVIARSGYGYVLTYPSWLFALCLFAYICGRSKAEKWPWVVHALVNSVIVAVLSASAFGLGFWLLLLEKRAMTEDCEQIVHELKAYIAEHGKTPNDPFSLASITSTSLSIDFGALKEGGFISCDGLNEVDARLYLSDTSYLVVIPVTRMLPMSFTRFYVLLLAEGEDEWRYQKIVWSWTRL
jgi:hypothetical protein